MYRDASAALDEHDRAVGAILIGEALIDECAHAAERVQHPVPGAEHDRWRAMTELQDTYPEIWRHLDRARRLLAARGANTAAYDELRPHARQVPTRHASAAEGERKIDHAALDDAKRALEELRLAVPGADWDAIQARTAGLVRAPLARRRRQRFAIAGMVAAFSLVIGTWVSAIVPAHKPDPAAQMRREIAQIQQQRKVRIDALFIGLGDRCRPDQAHELIRLLVMDGRVDDAAAFGATYVGRCGEDPVVEHWAHAPHPPSR